MSTRTEEVEKADRAVKDAEIRQRTLQTQLDALDTEIAAQEFNAYVVQENISSLKQDKIIALAQEYRKAKEELAKFNARLLQLSNDRTQVGHQLTEITKILNKAKEAHADLLYKLENNVLQGNFRKQADGQT